MRGIHSLGSKGEGVVGEGWVSRGGRREGDMSDAGNTQHRD